MVPKPNLELISICVVSVLLVVFASLYFVGTKKRKNLSAAIKNSNSLSDTHDREFGELVEKLRIAGAQLDLVFELGPVFTVCCDYGRNLFCISENGQSQLGYGESVGEGADQKKFESLIHGDDFSLYEEVTDFDDIRKHEMADSPYILRLMDSTGEYGRYLMRVKPIYDEENTNKALVLAFVKTEYMANELGIRS